ncbi:hypothetical protein [Marmoricola sp. Leaf446]|uniref:hypothetical protein n=1 Tax=Marmoricola sp. Leaf446 TaxID=1736379 RepID=UPI001F1D417A|nr:hypothetical protein [Marmoricola sp. Leaf446]
MWTTPHGYVLVTDKHGTRHLTDHPTHHATERPRLRVDVIRTPLQLAWAPAA